MRERLSTALLVMVMMLTVILRATPPTSAHAVTTETCSQVNVDERAPCAAPQQAGRVLEDMVSRANAWPLAMLLPILASTVMSERFVETSLARGRRSPRAPRRDVACKRYRVQPDANDPA